MIAIPLNEVIKEVQSGYASGERSLSGTVQVRMNNVSTDGYLSLEEYIRVPATAKQLDTFQLKPGDVLFNSTNSPELVGKSAIFKGYNEPVVFSNHFLRIRTDEARLIPEFLARWLTYQWQRRTFEKFCTRWVNQAAVRRDDLFALPIALPPVPEQKHHAALLDRADRLRHTRRYAQQLSDSFLQSVFLEMFGDPTTNPKGWELAEISHVCKELYRYPTFYGFQYIEKGTPVVRIGNILSEGFLNPDRKNYVFVEPEVSKKFPRTILELHDIVMAVRGDGSTVSRIGLLNSKNLVGANISPNLLLFRAKKDVVSPLYLFHLITSDAGQKLLEAYITRTAKKTITAEDIKQIKIPVPEYSLQQKFAQIVQKYQRLRAQQREADRQAEHLFQTLLHQAFRPN